MTRALLVLAGAALVAACKPAAAPGEAGGATGTPVAEQVCTPSPGDTFCPAYAATFCAAHFACCGDPSARYDTMERCTQRTTCLCTAHRQGAAADAGRVTLDPSAGDALLARLRAAPASCPAGAADALSLDAVFRGTLPAGADCSPTGGDYGTLYTCAPGLTCFLTDFGDAMNPAHADCRRPRASGETCDGSRLCGADLYCADGATIDDPGTCAPLRAAGAACDFDFQCASDVCDPAGTCAAPVADDVYCVDASTTT